MKADVEAVTGVRTIASAVLGANAASEEQVALAIAILETTANPPADAPPREAANIADEWNRMMDTLLDAENASRSASSRATRRYMMSLAIDRADLVVIDRGVVAGLINRIEKAEHEARAFAALCPPAPAA